jgi:hypothetical protein
MLYQLHMAHFIQLTDIDAKNSNTAWAFVGFAVRLGYSVRPAELDVLPTNQMST